MKYTAHVGPGHCYLMMDDLQQAYSAYQQALYHLRDPKVHLTLNTAVDEAKQNLGTEAVVRYRHPLRQIWISRACRGSLFPGHAYATRLRKVERDLLPPGHNL